MALSVDAGMANPTLKHDFDGFDGDTIDPGRWATTLAGGTTITETGGYAVFQNNAGQVAGESRIETIQKFGKEWLIAEDLEISSHSGTGGDISLELFLDSNNYVKLGPYFAPGVDCNAYLRYKVGGLPEVGVALTIDTIDATRIHNYAFAVMEDILLIYYDGLLRTTLPFRALINYKVRTTASKTLNADAIVAVANDYEVVNKVDTVLMTIGSLARYIKDNMGTSTITDVSGTLTLSDTTEQFIEFETATYGNKFSVNLFADLERATVGTCLLYDSNLDTYADETLLANMNPPIANSVDIVLDTGAVAGDCFYIGNPTEFHRVDFYLEGGTGNDDNVFVIEGWTGAAWVTLTATDGTLHNSMVLGSSGSITWSDTLTTKEVNGVTQYWMRLRVTTAGASLPKATRIQTPLDGATGFGGVAPFMSSLLVRMYRKKANGNYATLPIDLGLPFTQGILTRTINIEELKCWSDTKIGIKLTATPPDDIIINYTGFAQLLA